MGGSIRTNAAAAMLGVSPNTLRSWERRFGFPEPKRTAGGHRQFDLAEIEALRAAFEETQNISSAVSVARERGTGPASPARLQSAFGRFDEDGANRLMEESLTVRSVERTLEEVLLPSVEALAPAHNTPPTPEYGFAWRYATGWLAATQRLAPPASRSEGVLVFDASRAPEAECLQAQALELVLRRGGLRTLTLSADSDPSRLSHAITALDPRAVVLTGHGASLDTLGRLVFTARRPPPCRARRARRSCSASTTVPVPGASSAGRPRPSGCSAPLRAAGAAYSCGTEPVRFATQVR